MELPMAAVIAVLFAAGTHLIMRPNLIRLVMGFGLYSNATNLLLITVGGYTRSSGAPFVGADPKTAVGLMDPLPPDIILTAIVISFAVSALMLTICYRVYRDHGTDDPEELPVDDDFARTGELAIKATGTPHEGDGSGRVHGTLRLTPVGEGAPVAGRPAPRRKASRR
jgi:multisubunit Na+/H+ antiporter MnhC subunit